MPPVIERAEKFERDDRQDREHLKAVELAVGSLLLVELGRAAVGLSLLYAIVFVVAAVVAFQNPARAALLPSLVPRDLFPRAVTVASTNQALASPSNRGSIASQSRRAFNETTGDSQAPFREIRPATFPP